MPSPGAVSSEKEDQGECKKIVLSLVVVVVVVFSFKAIVLNSGIWVFFSVF